MVVASLPICTDLPQPLMPNNRTSSKFSCTGSNVRFVFIYLLTLSLHVIFSSYIFPVILTINGKISS